MEPQSNKEQSTIDSSQNQPKDSASHLISILQQSFPDFESTQKKTFKELLSDPHFDHALGCIIGAFIGDSLGSYCEFQREVSDKTMDQVMEMRGGGTFHGLIPGQVTDDSELALHMGYGLTEAYDPKTPLQNQSNALIQSIAKQYVHWMYKGQPFDIGRTCGGAFRRLNEQLNANQKDPTEFVRKAFKAVNNTNFESESNGSLMRITPMAVFASYVEHKTTPETLEKLIKSQINLTHTKPVIVEAGFEWVQLLKSMILRKSDEDIKGIYEKSYQRCLHQPLLYSWALDSAKHEPFRSGSMGWVKIAFCLGFYHLRNTLEDKNPVYDEKLFNNILRHVIQQGGDTDTNACIVGGLFGSILGIKRLPWRYVEKTMLAKTQLGGLRRHPRYNPRHGLQIVFKMMKFI